jgi:8-oxo-dGTP pyrophosphatase MutT (NUDIX family)
MSDLAAALALHLEVDPHPEPAPGDRLAAVLVVVIDDAEPAVLLTERATHLSRHAGEMSFPGGLRDRADVDLRATALRETHEEIGVDPAQLSVIGALPPIHTFVSAILVTPFVATVPRVPELTVSHSEIARVLTVSIRRLAAVEEERIVRDDREGVWRGWWYALPDATVWGATGSMVHALLALIRREAPWVMR